MDGRLGDVESLFVARLLVSLSILTLRNASIVGMGGEDGFYNVGCGMFGEWIRETVLLCVQQGTNDV